MTNKFFNILFILFLFVADNIAFAQIAASDPMDAETLAAIHQLSESDSPPFELYSTLSQSGALQRILNIASSIDRAPDVIILYDGTRQHQSFCLVDPATNQEITSVRKGAALCVVTLEDNMNERYRVEIEYRPDNISSWKIAARTTSLFSPLASQPQVIPLSSASINNIPYYAASVEFYRIEAPCEVRAEAVALPGAALPRKYFGWGVGGGFIVQEKANLRFQGDTVHVLTSTTKEMSGNGLLGVSVFAGRDPFRSYSASFWKTAFYRDFFQRWSLQAGLAFTRSNQLLEHYSVGLGFRLFGFLDLTGTMLFTSRPKENSISVISPSDFNRAEQIVQQKRESYFMFGCNINIMEW